VLTVLNLGSSVLAIRVIRFFSPSTLARNRFWPSSRGALFATKDLLLAQTTIRRIQGRIGTREGDIKGTPH
jgi:hypothetical protein